jgi:uncharacterized membrane protein
MDFAHINIAQAGPAVAASFLASLVEFVEALTIVLAVGTVRGWRPALMGAVGGVAVLAAVVAIAGPTLTLLPIAHMQVVVGALLLVFGLRWLRKAVLRGAGIIPLHDEMKVFNETGATIAGAEVARHALWDAVAIATTFKAMLIEGLEVVFIVIAVGSTGKMLEPASLGALAAALLVVVAGIVVHRPLARVPENTLKWAVGILLSAFGVFWIGEGLGLAWPGEDLFILVLASAFLLSSLAAIPTVRYRTSSSGR